MSVEKQYPGQSGTSISNTLATVSLTFSKINGSLNLEKVVSCLSVALKKYICYSLLSIVNDLLNFFKFKIKKNTKFSVKIKLSAT